MPKHALLITSVEPEDEGFGGGVIGGLDEVVEERAAVLLVHRHVARVLLEIDARRLPRQRLDPVSLLAALGRLALRGQVTEASHAVSPWVGFGRPGCGCRFCMGLPGLDELPQQRGLVQGGGVRQR